MVTKLNTNQNPTRKSEQTGDRMSHSRTYVPAGAAEERWG